jgi:hypothetical protein
MPKPDVHARTGGRKVVTPRSEIHIALYSIGERGVSVTCRCGGLDVRPMRYEDAKAAFVAHEAEAGS